MDFKDFTPTQQRMLKVLMDGLPHKRCELEACLDDDLHLTASGEPNSKAVTRRLSELRKMLRVQGLDVVCRALGGRGYCRFQLVRLIDGEG